MPFNTESWKDAISQRLIGWQARMRSAGIESAYAFLAATTILPAVEAVRQGELVPVILTLGSIAGGIGGNLLAEQIQRLKDADNATETELAAWLATETAVNKALRSGIDEVLTQLDVLPQAQADLSDADKAWFVETLQQELAALGNLAHYEQVFNINGDLIEQTVTLEKNRVLGDVSVIGKQVQFGTVETLNIQSAVFQLPPEPGQVAPADLLFTYLNQVVNDTRTLNLAGIDPEAISDQAEAQLELTAVYTELDTLRTRQPDGERIAERDTERARQSVLDFVSEAEYAALLGDPGSGKTTFGNYLTLCLAGEWLGLERANLARLGEGWQQPALLPVRVVLRDYAAQMDGAADAGLWSYIVNLMGPGLAGFAPLLNRYLLKDGGLLLLDGLDEVPEAQKRRDGVKQAILAFKRQYPKVRILLTSRTYAYQRQEWRLPEFEEAVLAPFSPEQIERFVDRWYAHMSHVRTNLPEKTAQGRAVLLKHAIERSPHLRELAPRPLLLTLMASLHAWRGGSLPDQREELYDESVTLLLDIWERPKIVLDAQGEPMLQQESAAEWFNAPQDEILKALEELAFKAHAAQPDEQSGTADIAEGDLVAALLHAADDPDLRPARVLAYIRDRAGLLTNRGEGVYSFPHRTFQEYLAARHLTQKQFPRLLVDLVRESPEKWREVLLLAGAKVAHGTPYAAWALVRRLCPRACEGAAPAQATNADWWTALLAGQLMLETGIANVDSLDEEEQAARAQVVGWLEALVAGGHLPPVDRAAAGVSLGRLGDPRPGVGVNPRSNLPDIEWVPIPPGPFVMGNTKDTDPDAFGDEAPQFECSLITEPYAISRYPVTVAQYRCFVAAGGYHEARYWTEAGWQWRNKRSITGPETYAAVFQTPNHPQVGVSWYEAVAFCNWLGEQLRQPVTLPTEAQWERAARHTDGRKYPWGAREIDVALACNMSESGIGTTSAVGIFPAGTAACGAADMSGNVWEWCRTAWKKSYNDYESQSEDALAGELSRVLRGGAFYYDRRGVRCASRYDDDPYGRYGDGGFRVAVSPFLTSDL